MRMKFLKQKDLKQYRYNKIAEQFGREPILDTNLIYPVLDHDHTSGKVRQVLDRDLNQFLGKIESNFKRFVSWKYPDYTLTEVLEGIVEYLKKDYSDNPYHPNHLKKVLREFNSMNKLQQCHILSELYGESLKEDQLGKTKQERLKLFKKALLNG